MEILQNLYDALGISQVVNDGDLLGVGAFFFLILASFLHTKTGKPPASSQLPQELPAEKKVATEIAPATKGEISAPPTAPRGISWTERLKQGMARSRSEVWGKIGRLVSQQKINADTLEELEELLYGADIGPAMVAEILQRLQEEARKGPVGDTIGFNKFIRELIEQKMGEVQSNVDKSLYQFSGQGAGDNAGGEEIPHAGTRVIMVVGVNGAGKTTTIGKLATKFKEQGANVVVGACDTFRAAAVDQLEVWCERAGATMVRAKEGANPTGVAYDALQTAINARADYCILDTAGRLHTKGSLMDELKKTKSVLAKLDPAAPHETLLVLDAITGQNALRQAEEFHNTLGLTGLIFTKCDGSSKAGSAIGIVDKLKVPITYIGVGEGVQDLNLFNLHEYLDALLEV